MPMDVRCGDCGYWLGESSQKLIHVECLAHSTETRVAPPRDLRLCKKCGRVNVFIAAADLDWRRVSVVG